MGAVPLQLDITIVNVAIDALGRDLNASLSTIQWVSTGYLLAPARDGAGRRDRGGGPGERRGWTPAQRG